MEPLRDDHAADLFSAAGGDEEVWRWLPIAAPRTPADMTRIVSGALAQQVAGLMLPFVVIGPEGEPVGCSSYLDIAVPDGRIEIGWTWYARRAWATTVNPAAKLLLLGHAFDTLGVERVSLKTDINNTRSQAAIARLGAAREGVLRHHMRRPDGSYRDTVYFSILRSEWPQVQAGLLDRLTVAERR